MIVEERLRQALADRASTVEASDDAWDRVVARLDAGSRRHRSPRRRGRHSRLIVLVGIASVTVMALVAALLVEAERDRSQRVSTIAQPSAPLPSPTASSAAAIAPVPDAPPTTALRGGTSPLAVESQVTSFAGIFPDTPSELERLQQAADNGSQPWRLDPVAAARAYLDGLGVQDAELGPAVPDHGLGQSVPYSAGAVTGMVALARSRAGSVYYVTASSTTRIENRRFERRGRSLAFDLFADAPGRLSVRSRPPGGSFGPAAAVVPDSSGGAELGLDVGDSGPVIVQLRHDGDDGAVALAELRINAAEQTADASPISVATTPPTVAVPVLTHDAPVRVDGVGPISVGMTEAEARAAAGLAFVVGDGPYCRSLAPDWDPTSLPAGFPPRAYDLVITKGAEERIDMVSVIRGPVATQSGIRVGSTEEDVLSAYDGQVEVSPSGTNRRWLVHRPSDPALADSSIVFVVHEGSVVSYRAGRRSVTESEEPCA